MNFFRCVGRTAVPFSITTDPLRMMWNHSLRWRGGSVKRVYSWFPVDRRGRYFAVRVLDTVAWDQQGYMKESRPNRLANFYAMYLARPISRTTDPGLGARQSGGGQPPGLEPPDGDAPGGKCPVSPTTTWTGVPRACSRTTDWYDGWNGAPDLYDWTLVGKREMFIPYNSYRLTSKRLKYADVLQPGHPQPRPVALRAAPGLGDRGDTAAGQTSPLSQANFLSG